MVTIATPIAMWLRLPAQVQDGVLAVFVALLQIMAVRQVAGTQPAARSPTPPTWATCCWP